MRQVLKTLITVMVLLGLAGVAVATEELAEKEDLVCTSCHDKPGSKLLTDKGKYYELMGSLDGYDRIEATFERCTYCHVKKPGSKKLTKKGKSFAFAVMDMEGLRQWLTSEHPGLGALDEAEKQGPEKEGGEPEEDDSKGEN